MAKTLKKKHDIFKDDFFEKTPEDFGGKIPPNDIEVEKLVIGALLIDNFSVNDVLQFLEPKHFYDNNNRSIFEAIISINEKNQPIDAVTLVEELKKLDKFNENLTREYITEIIEDITSSANVLQHARIVFDKYILRQLINISSVVVEKAFDMTVNPFSLLDRASQKYLEISESLSKKKVISVKDVLDNFIEDIVQRRKSKSSVTGVPTGFTLLDDYTAGFQPSELIIIAGRPSSGKTAFAMNIARNAAVQYNKSVAIFSLEMTHQELLNRMISGESQVDAKKIKTGRLSNEEWMRIANTFHRLKSDIYIDESSELSILELRAKARRLKQDHKIDMIIVDYLQLVKGMDNPERRDLEVAYVSRGLKALAKDLNIPVVACAQLNRGVETRGAKGEKRPQLADLRESGSIEQDADVVIFVHRPSQGKKLDETMPNYEEDKRKAEIIIGKQRNGPTADIEMLFISEFAKFENKTKSPVLEIDSSDYNPQF